MNPYAIRVDKSAGQLILTKGGQVVMRARASTGRRAGRKRAQGDLRTPEGAYRVCWKNPRSDYHLSLAIDYPAPHDAQVALRERRIDRETLQRIQAAHAANEIPPWDSPLGGEIFIHGEGSARDWTLGCVKLSNADIEKLYDLVPPGTPVVIGGQ